MQFSPLIPLTFLVKIFLTPLPLELRLYFACVLFNKIWFLLNSFFVNPLRANPTKWSKRLLQTTWLSVFDHFGGLARTGLTFAHGFSVRICFHCTCLFLIFQVFSIVF